MYSAIASREAPALVRRYFEPGDYVRTESLPPRLRVARKHSYVLPTTLRERWVGEPGLRHWIRQGCGPGTPGTIVYDPERRTLTPAREQNNLVESVHRAAALVNSTGCHDFGLAPGAMLLFGLDDKSCTYDLDRGFYREIRWRSVDLVDIQAQRLLSDPCIVKGGVDQYASAVSHLAAYVRARNPGIFVVSQVSFRDNHPTSMIEGIARVSEVVDGIYFSYPSTNPEFPCRYCSRANLEMFLEALRG
jgi:hypothetical protein